tara:strand:- start:97 stop:588 length:492 start_codon:yes stop_codon:yes gene_type:complete
MRKLPEVSEKEIYMAHLKKLRDRCDDYDAAHSYTRNINVFFDKFVKLSILVLSSLTTYFIASHDDEIIESDLDLDKKLTLSTTLVSGINAIFNFSDKAEIHRAIIADYLRLKNEINNYINNMDTDIKEVKKKYSEYFERFNKGNDKTVTIGIAICAKRKYKIT